jgi:hypothetical protein
MACDAAGLKELDVLTLSGELVQQWIGSADTSSGPSPCK